MLLHRTGTTRPGITLLEVLTAIFIMGIGLLALLTLFPVGALSMARAIRDDRAATIAANAAALAAAFDLRNDPVVAAAWSGPSRDPGAPSNPLYIDPDYAGRLNQTSLGSGTLAIQRLLPAYVRNPTTTSGTRQDNRIAQAFVFQEEIEFDSLGQPRGAPASVIRPGTYSWAYLLRKPRWSSEELVELTVIVYGSRNVDIAGGENAFAGSGTQGTTALTVTNATGADFRKGNWLLDLSKSRRPGVPGSSAEAEYIHGYFYRVETVTDKGGGSFELQLDRPIKEAISAGSGERNVVQMENVIAVVERGTDWGKAKP